MVGTSRQRTGVTAPLLGDRSANSSSSSSSSRPLTHITHHTHSHSHPLSPPSLSLLSSSSSLTSSSTTLRGSSPYPLSHGRSFVGPDSAEDLPPALLVQARKHQTRFHRSIPDRTLTQRVKRWCTFKEGSIAIFLVLSILLLLCLTIIGGLLTRPFFTFGLLMASGASLGFVLTEASSYGAWHHHREAENRFWIVVAIILSVTIIFAPDSPLSGLGSAFPVLGIMCVLLSASWVHYYDRKLERDELGRAPHLRRVSSFILTNQESTKQKLQVVVDCLAALDYRFVAAKALNQRQIQQAELDILNMLKSCDTQELNYILTNVNLSLLFYKIKDRDILTFNKTEVQNRTKVLELLARERLAELNIQARVVVLDALMNMRLKAHTSAEEWVRDIILGTHGRMLTRMKNACDLKGRVHNFHKLIYRDITSFAIRAEIIAHLRKEADVVKNDGLLPKDRRKILSDVDDTLFSSGGRFPAGLDTRYPRHVLYPGVCSFYKELDLGISSSGEWEEGRQGNLAFLSARPHVYKDKCFTPNLLLTSAGGTDVRAGDVRVGDLLRDQDGLPVRVMAVDRGYEEKVIKQANEADSNQQRIRIPRQHGSFEENRPLKVMYEFDLRDEFGGANEQTLTVTYDHTMLLMADSPIEYCELSTEDGGAFVQVNYWKFYSDQFTQPRRNRDTPNDLDVWQLGGAPYRDTTTSPVRIPSHIFTMPPSPARQLAVQPYYDAALAWAQLPSSIKDYPELVTCHVPVIWEPTAERYYHFLQWTYEVASTPLPIDATSEQIHQAAALRQSAYALASAWSLYQPSAVNMYRYGTATPTDDSASPCRPIGIPSDIPLQPAPRTLGKVVPVTYPSSSEPNFGDLCEAAIGVPISIELQSRLGWLVGAWLSGGAHERAVILQSDYRSDYSHSEVTHEMIAIARQVWELQNPGSEWEPDVHQRQVIRPASKMDQHDERDYHNIDSNRQWRLYPGLTDDSDDWFTSLLTHLTDLDSNSILHFKRVPTQILFGSIDLRRYCLAGFIDANGGRRDLTVPSSYILTISHDDQFLACDFTRLVRGLGYAIVGERTKCNEERFRLDTNDIAQMESILFDHIRIGGVPTDRRYIASTDEFDPTDVPCLLTLNRQPLVDRYGPDPRFFTWNCVPVGFMKSLNPSPLSTDNTHWKQLLECYEGHYQPRTNSTDFELLHGAPPRVRKLSPTHEYVGITVPGGQLLTSEHVIVHNSERASYRIFEELRLMKTMGLHCVPTLLAGSLDSGFHMFRGLYEPMSAKKFANFTEYASLYPEFKFCFIGDNGQGDARAGEMISEALPEQVEAIFIHEVQPIHRTPGYVNYETLKRYEKLKIFFFHTYVGAALQATRLKMIHPNGLRRITIDAVLYFLELKATLRQPVHVIDANRCELNRDIELANEYLVNELHLDPVNLIPADCIFHVGSAVETSWGIGQVERFNAITGIYQVRLNDWKMAHSHVRVYMHGSELTWHTKGQVGDAVSTRFGTGILQEIRMENAVHVIKLVEWGQAANLFPIHVGHSHQPQSSSAFSNAPYAYLQPDEFNVIVAAVGDQVQTVMGMGVVTAYRAPVIPQRPITNRHYIVPLHQLSTMHSEARAMDLPYTNLNANSNADAANTVIVPTSSPTKIGPTSSSPSTSETWPYTVVGIYTVKLAWPLSTGIHAGGAVAYLNGRSLKKIRETTQRRCVIQ